MSLQPPNILLSGPGSALATANLGSQLGFTWEPPSPAQEAANCRLLYFMPSGPGQNTSRHPSPSEISPVLWARVQLIFNGGQRFVVSGHSQFLQLTGLGKSLPLTCQQQSRLNHKRKVYSVYKEGEPQEPSLGDRGGCVTGPHRTLTTLGHATKTENHSRSTYYIEKTQGSCQNEKTKKHGPNERTD